MKILKFSAEWCKPCAQLAKALEGTIVGAFITPVDCDNDTEGLCEKYSVRNIPTILYITDKGGEIGRLTGSVTVKQIQDAYDKYAVSKKNR